MLYFELQSNSSLFCLDIKTYLEMFVAKISIRWPDINNLYFKFHALEHLCNFINRYVIVSATQPNSVLRKPPPKSPKPEEL